MTLLYNYVDVGKVEKLVSYGASIFKIIVSPIDDENIDMIVDSEEPLEVGTYIHLLVKIFDINGDSVFAKKSEIIK
ncbi:MAG: hypothetical protein QXW40_08095 [Thermofilum sp.]